MSGTGRMDDQPRGQRDHHWKLDQVERKGDVAQEPGQRREEAARGPVRKNTDQEQDGEDRLGLAGALPAMTFIGGDRQKKSFRTCERGPRPMQTGRVCHRSRENDANVTRFDDPRTARRPSIGAGRFVVDFRNPWTSVYYPTLIQLISRYNYV